MSEIETGNAFKVYRGFFGPLFQSAVVIIAAGALPPNGGLYDASILLSKEPGVKWIRGKFNNSLNLPDDQVLKILFDDALIASQGWVQNYFWEKLSSNEFNRMIDPAAFDLQEVESLVLYGLWARGRSESKLREVASRSRSQQLRDFLEKVFKSGKLELEDE
jgi:hypothetical protein